MNVNAENTFLSGQMKPLQKVRQLTPDLDAKLRSQFSKEKSLLADAAATLKISDEGREMNSQNTGRVTETHPAYVNNVIHLTRTGYASIDNPILDALAGQSEEIKNYVYGIINQNFFLEDAGDMTEQERQDAISLGLAKAKHIADNYMDDDTAKSFMQAMTKAANIASSGIREEDGKLDYGLPLFSVSSDEKGHTIEEPDSFNRTSGMMREYDPETYAKFKECMNAFKKADGDDKIEKFVDAVKIALKFINDMARNNPDVFKRYDRAVQARINNTSTAKLSDTFAGIEEKDNASFIEAIRKRLNETSHLKGDYWNHQMSLLQQMCKE